MQAFHLGKSKFAGDLTGKGAELFAGRWNRKGIPCIYTASSLSLSVLEYAVNNSLDNIPRALCYTVYEIPDKEYKKFSIASLPGDWMNRPAPVSTMDFGTRFLRECMHLVIAVPSVIVPEENNFLLNPLHEDFKKIKVVGIKDFVFDVRLKQ
ncbi:MAG: RES family NAD+ phosphorylase [Chitinophagaceae bacterium]